MSRKKGQLTKTQLKKRNKLVEEHIYLVNYVVNMMNVKPPPGVSRDDLLSIGSWGLIDAANKYDEDKGVLFKTYAVTRIRGSILDELRRNSLGGQTLCRKARLLEKAIRAVEQKQDGKSAKDEDVARELGVTPEKLQKLYTEVSRSFLISLDDFISTDDSGDAFVDTIQDKRSPDPSMQAEKSELKETILTIINEIPYQEQKVLTLYYYEELTFREIGYILEVSESRVSQIHTKAILRMRSRLKNSKLHIGRDLE